MFCVLSPIQLPNNSWAFPPKKCFYRIPIFFILKKNTNFLAGPGGKIFLKMTLFNLISGTGYNDRISHIFLIKMKIIRFVHALTFVYEILYDLIQWSHSGCPKDVIWRHLTLMTSNDVIWLIEKYVLFFFQIKIIFLYEEYF